MGWGTSSAVELALPSARGCGLPLTGSIWARLAASLRPCTYMPAFSSPDRIIAAVVQTYARRTRTPLGMVAVHATPYRDGKHVAPVSGCFLGGVSLENAACATAFEATSRHRLKTIWLEAVLDVIKSYVIKYGGMMCAFSVLIPSVYLAPKGSAKLGTPQQVTAWYLAQTQLLVALANAVKDLADSLGGAYTIILVSVCRFVCVA